MAHSLKKLSLLGALMLTAGAFIACGGDQSGTQPPERTQFGIFTVLDDGVTIEMDGEIGMNSLTNFQDLIADYPDAKRIDIIESPGSTDDLVNLQLSRLVNEREMDIRLLDGGLIASGGTDFFLAGRTRTIGADTMIGVHAWSDGVNEATDFPRGHMEHSRYISYYMDIGFSREWAEDFYYFTINAAPAADIHYMTEAEIERYGVLAP